MSKIPCEDKISEACGRAVWEGVLALRSISEKTNLEISPRLVSLLLGDMIQCIFFITG